MSMHKKNSNRHTLLPFPLLFSRMRSKRFPFYFGGLGVETRSLDAAFVSATVRNMAVPRASLQKLFLLEVSNVV